MRFNEFRHFKPTVSTESYGNSGLGAGGEVALDATVEVDRSHHGLTWNQFGMASMKNTVTIHAVFTKN